MNDSISEFNVRYAILFFIVSCDLSEEAEGLGKRGGGFRIEQFFGKMEMEGSLIGWFKC